jgi:hypothetical protein
LNKNKSVQSDADAVVGIGQASLRSHSKPAEDQHNSDQGNRQDLEIDMESESKSGVPVVEASDEDSRGDDEEEDEGSNNAVANDETVVLR